MASGPPGQKEREMGHENKEMQLLGSVDECQSKPYNDERGLETMLQTLLCSTFKLKLACLDQNGRPQLDAPGQKFV